MKTATVFLALLFTVFFTYTVVAQDTIHTESNHSPQQLDTKYFKKNIEVFFSFEAPSMDLIRELTNIISIANVRGMTVYAYANEKEYREFLTFNIKHTILPKPGELIIPEMSDNISEIMDWNVYPTYDAYVSMMMQYAANYPSICKLINAGETVEGRNILLVKISDNVNIREAEPQFFYSSTIHGDETAGYVLMLRLIDSLLTTYGTNPRITNLIDNAEIWINPLANPDGTYHGGNGTVNGAIRYNANGYDLNRNFPDPVNGVHPDQQPETTIFRTLAEQNNFVLCANFHGGSEVVCYPWDTWSNVFPDYVSHADEEWYQFISHLYADTCQEYSPPTYMNGFDDGISNGGAWYVLHGGRQDYMNWFMHSREVTIEINAGYILPGILLPAHWEYNRRSFLNYMENIFYGVRGIVTDTAGNPLNAMVEVLNHDTLNSEIRTDSLYGNYYRMLAPGIYSFYFSADGYFPQTVNNVLVTNFETTVLNVELIRNPVPVELISFTANAEGNNVVLNWQTATERNNRGFEIQRSRDRKGFLTFAFIEGNGTTTEQHNYTYNDKNLDNGKYYYRLKQVDYDGSYEFSNTVEVDLKIFTSFLLEQNYPNPFNPTTAICFGVPEKSNVKIIILNAIGKEVAVVLNEEKEAGYHQVKFNAANLPSGVYFYQLRAVDPSTGSGQVFVQTKKMILLK